MNILTSLFSDKYDELWKAIIRPYRDNYDVKELGPDKFHLSNHYYKRTDFSLQNKRNQKLLCSFWEPFDEEREYPQLPCVIYLHGNSSSRCEVVPLLKFLLPLNITIFSFDFAGCGHSEGEYISLGWYEPQDVETIISFLRKTKRISTIGIWGRSMGAVTAIIYGYKDPTIAGIVLDSPFYSLKMLIDEVSQDRVALPWFIISQVIKMMKNTIKEKAKFNIDDIEPWIYAKKCFIPAFFCHGKKDNFVNIHHCKDLYKIYPGEKKGVIIDGDHNSLRAKKVNDSISMFFFHALKCQYIQELCDYYKGSKLMFSEWNDPKIKTPTGNEKKNKLSKSIDHLNRVKMINEKINEEEKELKNKNIKFHNYLNLSKKGIQKIQIQKKINPLNLSTTNNDYPKDNYSKIKRNYNLTNINVGKMTPILNDNINNNEKSNSTQLSDFKDRNNIIKNNIENIKRQKEQKKSDPEFLDQTGFNNNEEINNVETNNIENNNIENNNIENNNIENNNDNQFFSKNGIINLNNQQQFMTYYQNSQTNFNQNINFIPQDNKTITQLNIINDNNNYNTYRYNNNNYLQTYNLPLTNYIGSEFNYEVNNGKLANYQLNNNNNYSMEEFNYQNFNNNYNYIQKTGRSYSMTYYDNVYGNLAYGQK